MSILKKTYRTITSSLAKFLIDRIIFLFLYFDYNGNNPQFCNFASGVFNNVSYGTSVLIDKNLNNINLIYIKNNCF